MKMPTLFLMLMALFLGACQSTQNLPSPEPMPTPEPEVKRDWTPPARTTGLIRNLIVVFKGFRPDDVITMEETMEQFPGYVTLRPTQSMSRRKVIQDKTSAQRSKFERY